jgi:hypothetical protein
LALIGIGYYWMKKQKEKNNMNSESFDEDMSIKPTPSYQDMANNAFTGMTPKFPFKTMTLS